MTDPCDASFKTLKEQVNWIRYLNVNKVKDIILNMYIESRYTRRGRRNIHQVKAQTSKQWHRQSSEMTLFEIFIYIKQILKYYNKLTKCCGLSDKSTWKAYHAFPLYLTCALDVEFDTTQNTRNRRNHSKTKVKCYYL